MASVRLHVHRLTAADANAYLRQAQVQTVGQRDTPELDAELATDAELGRRQRLQIIVIVVTTASLEREIWTDMRKQRTLRKTVAVAHVQRNRDVRRQHVTAINAKRVAVIFLATLLDHLEAQQTIYRRRAAVECRDRLRQVNTRREANLLDVKHLVAAHPTQAHRQVDRHIADKPLEATLGTRRDGHHRRHHQHK